MANFSSSGSSSYAKFVKLLQDISMTSQFHRQFFAVLVWQIIWSQKCDCLFWESFSPLCTICPQKVVFYQIFGNNDNNAIIIHSGWKESKSYIFSLGSFTSFQHFWKGWFMILQIFRPAQLSTEKKRHLEFLRFIFVDIDINVRFSLLFNNGPKLYIPSTLNIDLILWHTQLNVCAVKCL